MCENDRKIGLNDIVESNRSSTRVSHGWCYLLAFLSDMPSYLLVAIRWHRKGYGRERTRKNQKEVAVYEKRWLEKNET